MVRYKLEFEEIKEIQKGVLKKIQMLFIGKEFRVKDALNDPQVEVEYVKILTATGHSTCFLCGQKFSPTISDIALLKRIAVTNEYGDRIPTPVVHTECFYRFITGADIDLSFEHSTNYAINYGDCLSYKQFDSDGNVGKQILESLEPFYDEYTKPPYRNSILIHFKYLNQPSSRYLQSLRMSPSSIEELRLSPHVLFYTTFSFSSEALTSKHMLSSLSNFTHWDPRFGTRTSAVAPPTTIAKWLRPNYNIFPAYNFQVKPATKGAPTIIRTTQFFQEGSGITQGRKYFKFVGVSFADLFINSAMNVFDRLPNMNSAKNWLTKRELNTVVTQLPFALCEEAGYQVAVYNRDILPTAKQMNVLYPKNKEKKGQENQGKNKKKLPIYAGLDREILPYNAHPRNFFFATTTEHGKKNLPYFGFELEISYEKLFQEMVYSGRPDTSNQPVTDATKNGLNAKNLKLLVSKIFNSSQFSIPEVQLDRILSSEIGAVSTDPIDPAKNWKILSLIDGKINELSMAVSKTLPIKQIAKLGLIDVYALFANLVSELKLRTNLQNMVYSWRNVWAIQQEAHFAYYLFLKLAGFLEEYIYSSQETDWIKPFKDDFDRVTFIDNYFRSLVYDEENTTNEWTYSISILMEMLKVKTPTTPDFYRYATEETGIHAEMFLNDPLFAEELATWGRTHYFLQDTSNYIFSCNTLARKIGEAYGSRFNAQNPAPSRTGGSALVRNIERSMMNRYLNGNIFHKLPEEVVSLYYSKHDGTAGGGHGFEIISHPFTEAWIREHLKHISSLLSTIEAFGMTSGTGSSCGLHIHVTKKALTEMQYLNIILFVAVNTPFLRNFSRRDTMSLDRWASFGMFEGSLLPEERQKLTTEPYVPLNIKQAIYNKIESAPQLHGIKYNALHIGRDTTLEFRFLRGTLNYEIFMANLELVWAIIHFSKKAKDLHLQSFYKYILHPSRYDRYAHLINYITNVLEKTTDSWKEGDL